MCPQSKLWQFMNCVNKSSNKLKISASKLFTTGEGISINHKITRQIYSQSTLDPELLQTTNPLFARLWCWWMKRDLLFYSCADRLPVSIFSIIYSKSDIVSEENSEMASENIPAINNPTDDILEFRNVFENCKYVVAVTGAGVSAESGIPTFRGQGKFWRGHEVESIAMMSKFQEDPSLVWEVYHYRREITITKSPNAGHFALAEIEKRFEQEGKKFVIITQNIDELHTKAGSKNVIELHGSLFKTQCMDCGDIAENYDSPICPALDGKGCPEEGTADACISPEFLPRCSRDDCKGLLRPYIIWFDEDPTPENMRQSYEWLNECDLCLIIGTSSVVEPANEFAPLVRARGVPVAEFNIEKTNATKDCQFHIGGPTGTTLATALL